MLYRKIDFKENVIKFSILALLRGPNVWPGLRGTDLALGPLIEDPCSTMINVTANNQVCILKSYKAYNYTKINNGRLE